jgi:hypothetical protein
MLIGMTAAVSARVLARRAVREAERRRQAAATLRLTASSCTYAAAQLADGLPPGDARLAAIEMAGELEAVAASLRRAVRLGPAERRPLARMWAAAQVPTREIAARLGVSDRAARNYARGRRSDGQMWVGPVAGGRQVG